MSAKAGLAALIFVGLMGGLYVVGTTPQDPQSIGVAAARGMLHEPSSGQFSEVQTYKSRDGRAHAVCGMVRGKNLFGMMAPAQGFVALVQEEDGKLSSRGAVVRDPIDPRAYREAHSQYCQAGFRY